MADGVQIEIVSPEKLVFSQHARSATVPGSEGYFTVLGDHAPLMTTLKPGFVTITDDAGSAHNFYVRGGFADVGPDGLTILAEQASGLADFDRAEIDAAIAAIELELAAADTVEARTAATEILNGWRNLLLEAEQAMRSGAAH